MWTKVITWISVAALVLAVFLRSHVGDFVVSGLMMVILASLFGLRSQPLLSMVALTPRSEPL